MKKDWMRCSACGHGTDIKPNEPFIPLQVMVRDNNAETPDGDYKAIELYVCPACGTVKMDL